MKATLNLLLLMALAIGVQRVASRLVRAFLLSYAPLSGEGNDAMVYQRSLLTPGDYNNRLVWCLCIFSGLCAWLATRTGTGWLWSAGGALLAALGWDLWTWERAAVGVRRVCWRRGWRRGVRRIPVSQVAEVMVVERSLSWLGGDLGARLGSCYLRLQLRTGDAVKLPRTSVLRGLANLEDMANYLRMQMGVAAEEKRRAAKDKQRDDSRPRSPLPPAQQEALRQRLVALRTQAGGAGRPGSSDSRPMPGESLPPPGDSLPDAWPSDSELHSQPPDSRPGH